MKISFSKLGTHGRLGNSLFQIAGTLGLAEKYNAEASFPVWPLEGYFTDPLPHGEMQTNQVKEKHFHYHDWELTGDCDILGYLQSYRYFPKKNPFVFKSEFITEAKKGLKIAFEKETIAIHIRRGDYITNPKFNALYYQLPVTWFIKALLTIKDWQDKNVIIFSDDIPYCKVHFECLKNVFFSENRTPIQDVCLMSLCDNHIISNSSLSWWGAYLSEQKNVIHPKEIFRGEFAKKNIQDYWPDNWNCYWPDNFKLDLKDVTFTIPVFYDSPDRKANLDLTVCMLQKNFDTNIIIGEQGGNKFEYMGQWCRYMNFDLKYFHRTKMLNDMATASNTPYIANWDADVIIPPCQVYLTVERLRNGQDMEFPYDGRFARLPRIPWFKAIEKLLDIGAIGDTEPKGKRGRPVPESSVGGAVFFNKESFIDGGMENENMISFGPEDGERNERFTKLGFKTSVQDERVGGCLYHIDHWCGPDSSVKNPFFKANHAEIDKIRGMDQEQLRLYVDTWSWRHKYTEAYFHRISEGSIRSAKEIYKALDAIGVKSNFVIDIGCGVGEWSNGSATYDGVDYRIPEKSLLIKPEQYIDCNLETDIVTGKYDLCLCLEVAEHISEERADVLIEMLCNLSDKVLFSAAIPNQGGTGHINEKWQTYWEKKFHINGFAASKKQPDIRDNQNIELWYRNNIVLYVRDGVGKVTNFILPEYYEQIIQHYKNQVMQLQEV